jgi:hypothetical protein
VSNTHWVWALPPGAATATAIKVGTNRTAAGIAPAGAPNAGTLYLVTDRQRIDTRHRTRLQTIWAIAPGATTTATIHWGRHSWDVTMVIAPEEMGPFDPPWQAPPPVRQHSPSERVP